MESPGELYDKISILEIRLEKHTDVKACVEIRDKINVLRVELAHWDGPRCLLAPTHKLRATEPGDFSACSAPNLVVRLKIVNQKMWDNENKRDVLMRSAVSESSISDLPVQELEGLREADMREQQLNQDRHTIIDAINAKWLKGARP